MEMPLSNKTNSLRNSPAGYSKVNYISEHTGVKGCRKGGEEENRFREVVMSENAEELKERFPQI